jgi:large-conductance mechanosensitive channel
VTKPINEQRRELIQTLLVVGGIVGGLISTQTAYSALITPALVEFVIVASVIYSVMFIQKVPLFYPVGAVVLSGAFAYLLASIYSAVFNNFMGTVFTFGITWGAVLVGLIVDWNEYNRSQQAPRTTPSEAGKATTL